MSGAEVAISGAPASLRDLRSVARSDRHRVYLLGTVGVALVLIVLLRRVAVSIYLIGTVLLSYLVTLGVTFVTFRLIEGPSQSGLDWTVPMFLFTLMLAVGADYNVLLITRVDEEQGRHGPVRGVIEALRRTGGIISGCGVIMAGTFASLIWGGRLSSLYELGFALAFGVLLDTFVVRPLLVPSWLVLIHGGRLGRLGRWLGGAFGPTPTGRRGRGSAHRCRLGVEADGADDVVEVIRHDDRAVGEAGAADAPAAEDAVELVLIGRVVGDGGRRVLQLVAGEDADDAIARGDDPLVAELPARRRRWPRRPARTPGRRRRRGPWRP